MKIQRINEGLFSYSKGLFSTKYDIKQDQLSQLIGDMPVPFGINDNQLVMNVFKLTDEFVSSQIDMYTESLSDVIKSKESDEDKNNTSSSSSDEIFGGLNDHELYANKETFKNNVLKLVSGAHGDKGATLRTAWAETIVAAAEYVVTSSVLSSSTFSGNNVNLPVEVSEVSSDNKTISTKVSNKLKEITDEIMKEFDTVYKSAKKASSLKDYSSVIGNDSSLIIKDLDEKFRDPGSRAGGSAKALVKNIVTRCLAGITNIPEWNNIKTIMTSSDSKVAARGAAALVIVDSVLSISGDADNDVDKLLNSIGEFYDNYSIPDVSAIAAVGLKAAYDNVNKISRMNPANLQIRNVAVAMTRVLSKYK